MLYYRNLCSNLEVFPFLFFHHQHIHFLQLPTLPNVMSTHYPISIASTAPQAAPDEPRPGQQANGCVQHYPPHSTTRSTTNYYGFGKISQLCEQVILTLFDCPLTASLPTTSSPSTSSSARPIRLAEFIAYALHRTQLPAFVAFHALYLLKRLKQRFPSSRGSSGHRLIIAAMMIACKFACDDTYSNQSWTIVGQGMFTLREINTMEQELFGFLGYKVNVATEQLLRFADLLELGYLDQALYIPPPVTESCVSFPPTQEVVSPGGTAYAAEDLAPENTVGAGMARLATRSTRSSSSPLRHQSVTRSSTGREPSRSFGAWHAAVRASTVPSLAARTTRLSTPGSYPNQAYMAPPSAHSINVLSPIEVQETIMASPTGSAGHYAPPNSYRSPSRRRSSAAVSAESMCASRSPESSLASIAVSPGSAT